MRIRERGDGEVRTTVDTTLLAPWLQNVSSTPYVKITRSPNSLASQPFMDSVIRVNVDYKWTAVGGGDYRLDWLTYNNVKPLLLKKAAAMYSPPATTPTSVLASLESEIMLDVVTPHYRRRINAGEVINNPMSQEYQYVHSTPRSAIQTITPNIQQLTEVYVDDGTYKKCYLNGNAVGKIAKVAVAFDSTMWPSHETENLSAELQAIANTYEKLQSAELDVALMAAEGKQTLEFISQCIRRILRLIKLASNPKTLFMVAKKTWRKVKQSYADSIDLTKDYLWQGKWLAEAWLEVRYALRPLMYDIADAMKYFTEEKQRKGNRTTFRSTVREDEQTTFSKVVNGMELTYIVDRTVVSRAGILADKVLDSQWADLGFLNLAGVVWEKVKFSFILDWIINVTGLLYILNPTATWKAKAAWVKTVVMTSFSGTLTCDSPNGKIAVPIVGTLRSTHRSPVSGPPLTFIRVNLDTFKMLDLLALARGLRGNIAMLRL